MATRRSKPSPHAASALPSRWERLTAASDAITQLATQYGARNLRVFGSVARGADTAQSDVDLLVELDPGRSLLDLTKLELALEALLGERVKVCTPNSLSPLFRAQVEREARRL